MIFNCRTKCNRIWCLIIGPIVGYSILYGNVKVHCSLNEILKNENAIIINLSNTWNSTDEIDENKILFEPKDIYINSDKKVFILESNYIKIFDRNNKYIKTIGKPGGGPGELWNSNQIEIDRKNRVVVQDAGNNRIQIYDIDGKYIRGFGLLGYPPSQISINNKNEIIMLNQTITNDETPLWIYYDMNGKIIRKEGMREKSESEYMNKYKYDILLGNDKNNNVIKSFRYTPLIQISDYSRNREIDITYEVPFKVPEIKTYRKKEGVFVDTEMVCQSMAIDDIGRIYLLSIDKERSVDEKRIGSTIATIEGAIRVKPKVDYENANIYKILIFNMDGKLLSANKISNYANKIRVFNDKIYLIDTFVNMAIYEYKIAS